MQIEQRLAADLGVDAARVRAAVALLDEGASVPFIARYRKEATGALDDTQLRELHTRLGQLRELESRREAILRQLGDSGQLSDELKNSLLAADSRARLEDLYAPYRPKRRNKAQEAREAGLAPLAEALLSNPAQNPESAARPFIADDKGIPNVDSALEGARHILIEQLSESADLVEALRKALWQQGLLHTRAARGKADPDSKFRDYFDYAEAIARIPSHRALALLRGEQEGVIKYKLELPEGQENLGLELIQRHWRLRPHNLSAWMQATLEQCWSRKLQPQLENELVKRLREQSETAAIEVFARNLHDLLLASPAGARVTLGLDPGLRTGVKVAVIDRTGRLLEHTAIYPHAPRNQWDQSLATLAQLCRRHQVELIAIGNGTASRETEQLARELASRETGLQLQPVLVSEAGASVYSASELAAAEFPDLDVTIRGAVSIARRLQDPLAELVKIDPRSIGVGQYQHDVDQQQLTNSLEAVVETCVNHVGVDLNTASSALLRHVSGLNAGLADSIIAWRDEHGAFHNRRELLKVKRLGPKAFELCAGFLRIRDGEEPLDNSAVHPESYPLVKQIAQAAGLDQRQLLNQPERLRQLDPGRFVSERFGRYTVSDVFSELEKPGRDPRPEFRSVQYREGVSKLADLSPGMQLEGVVTNVTQFGAFVDIGVHQDGLVHISELADRFIKDPHEVVTSGQIVQVRVLEVDERRKRISLSMKQQDNTQRKADNSRKPVQREQPAAREGSLAERLRAAGIDTKR
ncbi:RNA-binding transcriptional accessory protein [Marinobacterium sp. D7]|uniref:Tex family protein n=1 Tax=Marinobacterium ramblicola TaxID=2849041 RepID=UPI001C2D7EC4|nr:Tex family protein [Marinobacterium ramblicola]MBV1787849.1 RNA-binding transcriptional accessory protein [Marinobacterium ramblicola]